MADVFKALADPTRRKVLDELTERDGQTLFEICGRLAKRHGMSSSRQAISQHLEVLEACGLVETKREGRYKFHFIDTTPIEPIIRRWLSPPGRTTRRTGATDMRITLTSVFVDDQEHAERFYTDVLGFVKKHDVPLGEHRWLTMTSPQDPDGPELLLEPSGHPAVGPYREALAADGIPCAQFDVDDVAAEHQRLLTRGVRFTQEPADMGDVTTAVFDDTCGNLIQIIHQDG